MTDGDIYRVNKVFDPATMSMIDQVVPTGEAVSVDQAEPETGAEIKADTATETVVDDKKKKRRLRRSKKKSE